MPKQQFVRKKKQRLSALFFCTGYAAIMLLSGTGIFLIATHNAPPVPSQSSPEHLPNTITCYLQIVIDGDTVTANCLQHNLRIRLLGIDAPEMGQEPWGHRAKEKLITLMPKTFRLNVAGLDIYHRVLGTLYDQQRNINLEMVKQGMAVAYRSNETEEQYLKAERQARKQQIGIWSQSGSQQNPKQWRRYHHL